jgi:hypothetical protein
MALDKVPTVGNVASAVRKVPWSWTSGTRAVSNTTRTCSRRPTGRLLAAAVPLDFDGLVVAPVPSMYSE